MYAMKIHKLYINSDKLFVLLIIILPLMDSLNGLLNGGANESGLSIGIVYRIAILALCLFLLFKYKIRLKKNYIYLLLIFILSLIIPLLLSINYFSSFIVLLTKLWLPIIIILVFKSLSNKDDVQNYICLIMNVWLVLFPLCIIVPYLMKSGFHTYGEEGFKGFFYANNDIGYILAVLYPYSLIKVIDKFNIKNTFVLLLVLGSNLTLGLKSNYIIILLVTIYELFRHEKNFNKYFRKLFLFTIIIFGIFLIYLLFENKIIQIVDRWKYFFDRRSFMSFFTSSRSDRIIPAFQWLFSKYGILGVLFGSGYNAIAENGFVEMDLFDMLLEYGIFGSTIVYSIYWSIYLKHKHIKFYSNAFLLSILIGTLSGHVFETALSGVFLSVICSGMNANSQKNSLIY